MPDLHDYVYWRGDLPFDRVPAGEGDDLLFSQLAYINFGPFVPGAGLYPHFVTLRAAAERLLEYDGEGTRIHQHPFMWKKLRKLLEGCAASARFGDVKLCAYVDELSDESQFAALCFLPPAGPAVIAFRGTDDSIAGWKEDLRMVLDEPIPAQIRAQSYLNALCAHLPGEVVLTGHSKGGNLAVFSACRAEETVQKRILRVVNLDGPGFSRTLMESLGYQAMRDKIRAYLPESAVVGRLLEQEGEHAIIRSDAAGLLQHDAFSWQLTGGRLLRAGSMTPYSEYLTAAVRAWLEQLDGTQRAEFLTELLEMLDQVDARKLKDAPAAFFAALPQLIRRMQTVDKTHKDALLRLTVDLGEATLRSVRDLLKNRSGVQDDGASIDKQE